MDGWPCMVAQDLQLGDEACAVHEASLQALVALYGKAWTPGALPDSWAGARALYLHKKGSKTEVSDYRPISLISVPAKTCTRPWAGHGLVGYRTLGLNTCNVVKEQGCGRKGQGAPAQLWAFLNLVEEGMEGAQAEGGGAGLGAQPGAYALFDDVAKADDQVWRDGLYLTLVVGGQP